jgi:putative transposase
VLTPAARREVVEFIKRKQISERRGCAPVSLNRKSHGYRQRRKPLKKLTEKIRQLAMIHPRFGYRRIWALLRRGGMKINFKKVYRLWKQEKLSLPKRKPRKARAKSGIGILPKAEKANQMWTYDACV